MSGTTYEWRIHADTGDLYALEFTEGRITAAAGPRDYDATVNAVIDEVMIDKYGPWGFEFEMQDRYGPDWNFPDGHGLTVSGNRYVHLDSFGFDEIDEIIERRSAERADTHGEERDWQNKAVANAKYQLAKNEIINDYRPAARLRNWARTQKWLTPALTDIA